MRLGNQNKAIELLVDGEKAFSRIIKRIRNATKSIYISMFIWRDDKIGNSILQELIDAADRGVKICIVKDKLGEVFEKSEENKQSIFHKEFNFGLWFKAVAIDIMYPMRGKPRSRKQSSNPLVQKLLNYCNVDVNNEAILGDHSKYYIFDKDILIMGGMNIEDKTIYTDVEGKKYNDYMVEMVGSVYVEKFTQRLNTGIRFNEKSLVEFIFNARRNGEIIYGAKSRILRILSSAKESIDIIMAYIGDKEITEKIIESANRGVSIKILLPAKSNIQHDLNMKVLKYIMKKTDNKVNVYLSKNMVHAKLIRVDNQVLTFGSTNLNKQAMKRLLELNVFMKNYDQDFSEVLEESIQRNITDATRIRNGSSIKFNPIRAMLEQMV